VQENKAIKYLVGEDQRISRNILRLLKDGYGREDIRNNIVSDVLSLIRRVRDLVSDLSQDDYSRAMKIVDGWIHHLSYYRVTVPITILPAQKIFSYQDYESASGGRAIKGVVVRKVSNKTANIEVTRRVKDRITGKYITRSKRFQVHDENNSCREGHVVLAVECAPFSATKHHKLVAIVGENAQAASNFRRRRGAYPKGSPAA
jgi:small subunit ribosomal protein S17